MAIPTILTITPNQGQTLGRTLIEITGSNFQLPPPPPDEGVVPVAPPTVRVTFDGVEALDVAVITQGRLIVLNPSGCENKNQINQRVGVDVVVENIDSDGDLIPGETVTETAGFTYFYPQLHLQQDLLRFTREVMLDIRKQVHPNINLTIHTDYSSASKQAVQLTEIAEFPAIVLFGPDVLENRFYSTNTLSVVDEIDGEFTEQRESRTVDIGFEVMLLSDSTQQLLNLMHVFTQYLHLNKFFLWTPDPVNDPTTILELEMDVQPGGDIRWDSEPNESNVRQARGSFLIRGFEFAGPKIGKGAQLGESQINAVTGDEDPILEVIEQLGETFDAGASPGGCCK